MRIIPLIAGAALAAGVTAPAHAEIDWTKVDQAIGRPTWIGSAMIPFASDRSFLLSTSKTRSSVPPRTKAIDLPSGEKRGA